MTEARALDAPGPGRPRGFDTDAAVDAGVDLFRRRGFEATSLEALTEAMGISRSSFYAAFGSKHGVLIAALKRYSARRIAALAGLADVPDAPMTLLRALSGLADDANGCLLVNSVTELAPRDPDVAALGARHLAAIETVVARALDPARPDAARNRAAVLLAVALGAQTMRKAGRPVAEIEALLAHAAALFAPPG
jgi:TetR/AcrR family transcriptional repressor of nem operon